jgi:hypothetical protein
LQVEYVGRALWGFLHILLQISGWQKSAKLIYGLLGVSFSHLDQFLSLTMTTLDTTRDPSINKHGFTSNDYTVGWICALEIELAVSQAMLDEVYPDLLQDEKDSNTYTLGRIGQHNVVLACLPSGTTGTDAAATAAKDLLRSFPKIRFGLMVGVGGGAPGHPSDDPNEDLHLGDVVVSNPESGHGRREFD